MKMLGLSTIITTVMLFPTCECTQSRNSSAKSPIVFTPFNITKQWWGNPDRWQKFLRTSHNAQKKDLKVIASSFGLGVTVLAVAAAVTEQNKFPQLDPTLAYYHTSAYRWFLRQLSLYPDLLFEKLFESHKVWRRRYYFEDALVPQWLRKSLVWVNSATWDKEDDMFKRFNKYGKNTFEQYARYPPKQFVSNETFSNSSSMFYPGPFDDKDY